MSVSGILSSNLLNFSSQSIQSNAAASDALLDEKLAIGGDIAQTEAAGNGEWVVRFSGEGEGMDLSPSQGRTGPDFVTGSAPRQTLSALVQGAGGNFLRAAENDGVAAVIGRIAVRDEGQVLPVGRETQIVHCAFAIQQFSDGVFDLAHYLVRKKADGLKRIFSSVS